jgi:RNA polymerase sigma-70 factor, ECF subfamily
MPETTGPGAQARDFRSVYAEHFAFVWRCLRGLGVAADALDDAAQEVFVIVHRRLQEFRGESSVRTWLYGIVRNVASNQRRGERRRGHVMALPGDVASASPGPFERLADREAADFVQSFLAELGDAKRELFVLVLLEELSVAEAAQALNIPLNTAYTRLRSVRIDFKRALARRGGRP